jgi:hypothetical protein
MVIASPHRHIQLQVAGLSAAFSGTAMAPSQKCRAGDGLKRKPPYTKVQSIDA